MYKKHKYDIVILFALVGLSVSGFLTITKILGIPVPCATTNGCETVLTSRYSEVYGIPLSLYGIAYFLSVIVLGLLANHYHKFRRMLTWVLALGALSAAGFVSLQLFVIRSLCQYCLVADAIAIFIFFWDLNIELKDQNLKNY